MDPDSCGFNRDKKRENAMALQVVEKGIYQVMSDGTKTCVPFGITKRERAKQEYELAKKQEYAIARRLEVAASMLTKCFDRIEEETGLTATGKINTNDGWWKWNDPRIVS